MHSLNLSPVACRSGRFRDFMAKGRTRSTNALNALARRNDFGIDARTKLTPVQIEEISRRR